MCWHACFALHLTERYVFDIVRCNPHHIPYSTVSLLWGKRYWKEKTSSHVQQWQVIKANLFHWGYGGSPNEMGKMFQLGQLAYTMANPRIGESNPAKDYNPGWKYGIESQIERAVCNARVERVILQKRPSNPDKDYVWDIIKGKAKLPTQQLPAAQERVSWNSETRGNLGFACSPDFFLPEPDFRFLDHEYKRVDLCVPGITHDRLVCSPEESEEESDVENTDEESENEEDRQLQLDNLQDIWNNLTNTEGIEPIPKTYTEWKNSNSELEGQDVLICSKKWREMLSRIYRQMYERQREEWAEETCKRLREEQAEANRK